MRIDAPAGAELEERTMALSEKDLQKIEAVFDRQIKNLTYAGGKRKGKDWIKLTKKRLYAYPLLKGNIERCKLDIEDIKREEFGKSKSITMFSINGGGAEKPTLEELREAKILLVERKIARDEAEIKEIDAALATVKDDYYYPAIEMMFFKRCKQDDIAEKLYCDKTTIWRQVGRLLDIMSITLYGADVLKFYP